MKAKSILTHILLFSVVFTWQTPVLFASSYDYGTDGTGTYDYGTDGTGAYDYGTDDTGTYDYGTDDSGIYDYGTDDGTDDDTPVPPAPVPPAPVPPTPAPVITPTPVTYSPPVASGSIIYYPPTVDIKANNSNGPISIPYGTSAYLYWSASNALSCWASNNWSGLKSNFGSQSTGALTSSKTYTITCLGQAGSATDSVTVNIESVSSQLAVKKSVRNIAQNTPYQNMVYALPEESLSFKIEVGLVGNQEAFNVVAKDILPSGIIYRGNLRINDQSISGDILNIPLGNFVKDQIKTITFDAQVAAKENFKQGVAPLYNQISVKADNFAEISGSATINVNTLSGDVLLSVSKMVKNVTKDDAEWKNETVSESGNILLFQIKAVNIKNAPISNIKIKDILPSKINYVGNLFVDGVPDSQDIRTGVSLGELASGQTKTITFEAKVADESNFNFGNTELINITNVFNDDFSLFATAKISVTKKGVLGATDIITGINVVYIALAISLILSLALYFLIFYLDNSPRPFTRKIARSYYQIKSFMFR